MNNKENVPNMAKNGLSKKEEEELKHLEEEQRQLIDKAYLGTTTKADQERHAEITKRVRSLQEKRTAFETELARVRHEEWKAKAEELLQETKRSLEAEGNSPEQIEKLEKQARQAAKEKK